MIREEILVVARSGIEPEEEIIEIGAVFFAGLSICRSREVIKVELAVGRAQIAEAQIVGLVPIVVVGDDAVRIEAREIVGPTEAAGETAAAGGKTARGVAAAFGES